MCNRIQRTVHRLTKKLDTLRPPPSTSIDLLIIYSIEISPTCPIQPFNSQSTHLLTINGSLLDTNSYASLYDFAATNINPPPPGFPCSSTRYPDTIHIFCVCRKLSTHFLCSSKYG